jgi:hypothetical protein
VAAFQNPQTSLGSIFQGLQDRQGQGQNQGARPLVGLPAFGSSSAPSGAGAPQWQPPWVHENPAMSGFRTRLLQILQDKFPQLADRMAQTQSNFQGGGLGGFFNPNSGTGGGPY